MPGSMLHDISRSVIQSWPVPNYEDPVQRQWFPPYAITLQGVTTALLLARLWSRFRKYSGRLGVDDLLIFIGWMFATGLTIVFVLGTTEYGFDRHAWDVQRENLDRAAFVLWLSSILFFVGTALVKCSILIFYRRLIGTTYCIAWVWTCWACIIFTVVFTIALLIAAFVICLPFGSYWASFSPNFDSGSAKCVDEQAFWIVAGVLGVISDFYALFLPGLLLWRLQMTRGQRIGLAAIFVLALIAVGAGIARSVYLREFTQFDRSDLTWLQFPIFVTSQFEIQIAIMCACAPSLKAFLSETITLPLQDAYRKSSKHVSTSLTSIYSDGSRFHHPRNASSNYSHRRSPSSKDWGKQKPGQTPVELDKRNDSAQSHSTTGSARSAGSPGKFCQPSPSHQRSNYAPSTLTPISSRNFNSNTPSTSASRSRRGSGSDYADSSTHLPMPPVSAFNRHNLFSPMHATSPLLPLYNSNDRQTSSRGAPSSVGSPVPLVELKEREPRRRSRLQRPQYTLDRKQQQSPRDSSRRANHRDRDQRERELERQWRAEAECEAAEAASAKGGDNFGNAVLEPHGWSQGLSTDEAFDRYQEGKMGPLPPPKDEDGNEGQRSASSRRGRSRSRSGSKARGGEFVEIAIAV